MTDTDRLDALAREPGKLMVRVADGHLFGVSRWPEHPEPAVWHRTLREALDELAAQPGAQGGAQ